MFCSKYFKHLQFLIPYPITHNCSIKPAISLLLDSILTSNINATQKVVKSVIRNIIVLICYDFKSTTT